MHHVTLTSLGMGALLNRLSPGSKLLPSQACCIFLEPLAQTQPAFKTFQAATVVTSTGDGPRSVRLRAVIRYDGGFLLRNASVLQRAPRILANLIPLFLKVPAC